MFRRLGQTKGIKRHNFDRKGICFVKKIVAVLLCVLFIGCCFFGCGKSEASSLKVEGTYPRDYEGTVLNVYNWGQYMSDGSEGSLNVNEEFEKLTGIQVNYAEYESNESLYTKLKSGGAAYDIIIPSDYMVARLIKEDLLQKFDPTVLSNYKYILDDFKNIYFDPNNEYSVPYQYCCVGLIYNTTMVEGTPDSWSIMWDQKYSGNILNFNNSRDGFGVAQYYLQQDINTADKADWDAAFEKLKEQKPLIQSYVMDEVFNKMEGGNAAIAPYYSGDFLTMQEVNPDLAFVYPKEGSNISVDSVCIPACAGNVEAAKLYINFLMEPEVALANAETICYASPNSAVISNPNYSLKDNEVIYPPQDVLKKMQFFQNLDQETLAYINNLWNQLKIS
ncbi:MAG TPA: spermidine/putrescine ABC transporter substrate-binding protein [Ruminococcaceae bacterium]|nr:spermidine/putrescine ABC transporter substrate-binding protein [Oscillospiraceae bacterium]